MTNTNDTTKEKDPKETKAFQRLKKKLTIDLLWIWTLKLLKERPKYAYELRSEFKERFGFNPATVTYYAVLYMLEKEGIVKKVVIADNTERIDRKYYAITDFGYKLLEEAKIFLKSTYEKIFAEEEK